MRGTRKRLAAVVAAVGTTVTEIFGVGPVITAAIIAATRDVCRFADRDHFAAYNGTAPVAAAWLHDIGYAPELVDTGFHSLDGARYLRRIDVDDRIVSLVAYHSYALIEAEVRGLVTF